MGLNSLAYGFINAMNSYGGRPLIDNPFEFTLGHILILFAVCITSELVLKLIDNKIGDGNETY